MAEASLPPIRIQRWQLLTDRKPSGRHAVAATVDIPRLAVPVVAPAETGWD